MRSNSRTTVLAFVIMMTLGAAAAGSASAALPEFSSKTGLIKGKPFAAVFRQGGGGAWEFGDGSGSTSQFSAEITSNTTIGNASFIFTAGTEGACHNSAEWGFTAASFKGHLGYISKSAKTVGLMFEPAKEPFAKCTQNFANRELAGDFIAKVTPVHIMTRKFTLTFEANTEGKQSPEWFEGETEKNPTTLPLSIGTLWQCLIVSGKEFCTFLNEDKRLGLSVLIPVETATETEIRA